ncbi:MAG: type VI secretion system tip protein VgrG, partial [Planctomycetes bacterium]|nr:type VI secretion system tip protein VgrG [Planctomycetota bacterium]
MPAILQDERLLLIKTPLPKKDGEEILLVNRFDCTERISRPFGIELELVAEPSNADSVSADALIGKPLTVSLALEDGSLRHFHGLVSRFTEGGRDARFAYYHAEVVPWLWLLMLTSDCRIFQEKTVPQIVAEIFDELRKDFPGLVNVRDTTKAENHRPWDYCVQYRETDFNFVSRLMEHEGICYFFEHEENQHTLVMAEEARVHKVCPKLKDGEAPFQPEGGTRDRVDFVTSWEKATAMRPGKYLLRDYHFQRPNTKLDPSNNLEVPENTKFK